MPRVAGSAGRPVAAGRRRAAAGLLVLAVALLHFAAGSWWFDQRLSDGAADPPPKPIEVAFVKAMPMAVPAVVHPAPRAAPRRRTAVQAVMAADAASASQRSAEVVPTPASGPDTADRDRPTDDPLDPGAAARADAADGPASAVEAADAGAPAASAAVADAFEWPLSTQLLYTLTGNDRGPLKGHAEVDWLRDGPHYQVRVTVSVPPVFSRRLLSDGRLGPDGLQPRRYDEQTDILLRAPQRATVLFSQDVIHLANGRAAPAPAGVQDAASQFVQMTYLFLTRPDALQLGRTVVFPLALPRRIGRWTYDVADRGPLVLPFGSVECVHLTPRGDDRGPQELTIETWVAPALQYLPVRIVIRRDAQTYLDLQLKAPPRQAAAAGPPASAASAAPVPM